MDDTIVLVSDDGQEYEMRILLTVENEETGRHYVFITDIEPPENEEEQNVLVYTYDEDVRRSSACLYRGKRWLRRKQEQRPEKRES